MMPFKNSMEVSVLQTIIFFLLYQGCEIAKRLVIYKTITETVVDSCLC